MSNDSLEKRVKPEVQVLCSNKLIDGDILLDIEGNTPILLGEGEYPKVWINLPLSSTNDWVNVVSDSSVVDFDKGILKKNLFTLTRSINERFVELKFAKKKIFHVKYNSENALEIDFLDLRPIGFNIFGDDKSLTIGGQTLKGNTMSGVGTMIAIGGPSN